MVRELFIDVYLLFFKMLFNFLNILPLKNKLTFVITFGDNSRYVYDEMIKQKIAVDKVVLYKGAGNKYFEDADGIKSIPFGPSNVSSFFKAVYHLATSKYILIDNYFGFLAVANFREEVECIQLWHASGAIKKFGLADQSVAKRSKRARKRFLKVYEKFDKVIVGSDIMADIFMEAFDLSDKNILYTGIPRTDFFYNDNMKGKVIDRFNKGFPELMRRKKILYAPTYRDSELDHFKIMLDLDMLKNELGNEYSLLLRLHPAIKHTTDYTETYSGFVYDFSSAAFDINELMLISDYLITDYSSIPYEFSLLNKPMIFFAYDLDVYKKDRGLWDQYENMVPGPVVQSTEEVIAAIKENKFDMDLIREYSGKWNKYSNGESSKRLVDYMFKE